ncbi:META domain-containing protein [Saccharicrinis carchari]|uniref:META domain-containing protein n=1 Tax=Saccharicrinis carchari TaxID=1168039 RepID=A0A521DMM8_SACCC|nr:META domain-containing protein [Saccharicrinis carchari]SMO72878.1 META domain-containing protein [Saccharicrinis carchari]
MMKNLLIAATLMLLWACTGIKETSTKQALETNVPSASGNTFERQMKGIEFYASGNNGGWTLEIDFDRVVRFFRANEDSVFEVNIVTLGEGLKGPDATHQVANSEGELNIEIKTKENPFAQEDAFPYHVSLKYIDFKTNTTYEFVGGGEFYGAIALHDIWMLEKMDRDKLKIAQDEQQPYMEIHLDKQKVMGHLGCNAFTADVYFGRKQISFSSVMSTKIGCPVLKLEQQFAKAIGNHTFNYRFENLHLMLENEKDTLIFRKTD